jgi:hypothetical protein
LRREKLKKVPGLAEAIDWARALQATGVRVLERADVEQTAGVLLKDHDDIKTLRGGLIESLLGKARSGESV